MIKHAKLLLLSVATASLFMSACTKPTIMDACMQYKRSSDCDAEVRKIIPTTIKCEERVKRYQGQCSQTDIEYAYEAFKQDADKICSFKSKEQLKNFKSSFDLKKMSANCNKLTEQEGE